MDVSTSDEEFDFIKRAPQMKIVISPVVDDLRPGTPPMDRSMKLNRSLGLVMSPHSPPYRRIRSMRLVESPRSILKPRLDKPFTSTPEGSPCAFKRVPKSAPVRMYRSRLNLLAQPDSNEKALHSAAISKAYINPLSPLGRCGVESRIKSQNRSFSLKNCSFDCDDKVEAELNDDDDDEGLEQIEVKKPKLSDFNTSRYQEEFLQLEVIGVGVHGCVYRCINRMNGMEYAVKKGLRPISNERVAHNEIYAHGILEHPNIVRNYSSWTEDDHVFMQNEYCNGGSLEDLIKTGPLEEKELRKILKHVTQGLRYIHSMNLAHMDIKPGNILIHRGPRLFYMYTYDYSDDFCDEDDQNEETIYKIADLGHVTRLDEVVDVVEGDCRYFPREILNDDNSNLTKVDIFALGLTLYEAAGGGPLPKNGDEWHNIRDGMLISFPHLSNTFNNLLKRMVHPTPESRPTASELLSQISMSPVYKTVKDKHELKAAKQRIQVLEQQLQELMKCVNVLRSQTPTKKRIAFVKANNNNSERLVGKKSKRSQSTTSF